MEMDQPAATYVAQNFTGSDLRPSSALTVSG